MSSAETPAPTRRRLLTSIRASRAFQVAAVGLIALAVLIVSALLYGELPEFFHVGGQQLRDFMRHNAYLPGFALLYIEESGVPLPAPGDVFVMYVGAHVPHTLPALLAAWLGLILAVVLGASNLYLVSRRAGARIVETRVAGWVHLTPERLRRAEAWFARYGTLAIIFGRHIPGFRVPITVAAGVFRVPYQVFALSVAISTAIWAGFFLVIGAVFGGRIEAFLRLHRETYWLLGAAIAIVVGTYLVRRWRTLRAKPGAV
jgi:membrane protein DedA with SNARE-associated domain